MKYTKPQKAAAVHRWGVPWEITPRVLTEALAAGGAKAKRALAAMMTMDKIGIVTTEAAWRGPPLE